MNIIQEKNWVITTKKGKGKLPLFCGNVERVFSIYVSHQVGILVHHLNIIYECSVTCPILEFFVSLINYNKTQRHLLPQREILKIISNNQLNK